MSDTLEAAIAETERLRGVIARNRGAFDRLKVDAQRWRDRVIRAEAALAEARRQNVDPVEAATEGIMDLLRARGVTMKP